MPTILTYLRGLKYSLLVCTVLMQYAAQAQHSRQIQVSFTDSLMADQSSTFLYNTIKIQNNSKQAQTLKINMVCPKQWRILSDTHSDITIQPGIEAQLPVTIAKRNTTSAQWQAFDVQLQYTDNQRDTFHFYVGAEALSGFLVSQPYVLPAEGKTRTFETSFQLKNTGNVKGLYIITINNEELGLYQRKEVELLPAKDTIYKLTYEIPKDKWLHYKTGSVMFGVYDSFFVSKTTKNRDRFVRENTGNINNANPFTTSLDFTRTDSVFQEHRSGYRDMKLDVETGTVSSFNMISYYYGFRAIVPLSDNSTLSATYRSRQLGLYNILARDIYNICYDSKKWRITAGLVNDSRYFRTFGNGLSITYKVNNNTQITAFGVIHTPGFFATSDNAGLNLRYKVGKARVSQDLIYNTDSGSRVNSYLLNNDIDILRTKETILSINGGVGLKDETSVQGKRESLLGGYAGYRFSHKIKDWTVASQIRYYDKNFPGINRGAVTHNHSIRYNWEKTKISTELYYQYEHRLNNFFKDTLYNTDLLTYNTSRYGIRISKSTERSYISVGGGLLQQTGQMNYVLTPQYKFLELMYNYRSVKGINASLSSTTGFSTISDELAYITSSNASANYKFFGVNGGFSSTPNIETKANGERIVANKNETVYGGPYVTVKIAKGLYAGANYTVSKTLMDNRTNTFAGVNVQYANDKYGIFFNLNGSSPLQSTSTQYNGNPFQYGYLNATLRKSLNIPFVLKRRYHNMKARMFADENGNGKMDANEKPISGLTFVVNDANFVTDKSGSILYKNIDTGKYQIDFSNTSVEGYMPGDGNTQIVSVHGKTSIDIAFKKSKLVKGHIDILQDTASDVRFSTNNIKVIAYSRDSMAYEYTTVANRDGDYFINLPAGKYTISLNPEVFNESFQPVKMSFDVDLINDENVVVDFKIKQRKRQLKIINSGATEEVVIKKNELTENKAPKAKNSKKTNNTPNTKNKSYEKTNRSNNSTTSDVRNRSCLRPIR